MDNSARTSLPRRRILRVTVILTLATVGLFAGVLGVGYWQSSRDLNRSYTHIRTRHAGDRLQSLLACVQDPQESLAVRNDAVWILGELRDERALPVLTGLVMGEECDHRREICQYELHKAMDKIKTGHEPALWRWVRNVMTPCTRAEEGDA